MKKRTLYLILVGLLFTGCKKQLNNGYNQIAKDRISPKVAFTSDKSIELYINSFYKILPTGDGITQGDAMSDYVAIKSVPSYLIPGAYDSRNAGGWSWGALRNVNYFIVNAPDQALDAGIREKDVENYLGIARFFRAWFYFEKVKRFGDVPWYSKPLDPSDTSNLYKHRDPRTLVMDSVLADLDYAVNNISDEKDNECSRITKWVALAFKSRVCLFEGTYRKYHPDLDLKSTANKWFQETVSADSILIQSGKYKIHLNNTHPELSYRELFVDDSGHPPNDETILSANYSAELNIFNMSAWYYLSPTRGDRVSFTKPFINTYLSRNGNPFTDASDFETIPFWEEVTNRDLRLSQTIRMEGYERSDGDKQAPDFSFTPTGYQPIKYVLDSKRADDGIFSDNSIPIIRYAEVLLNYAEAKAELGSFTQADWDRTIKVLRERAGITNTSMPTTADPYLQSVYFPNISDPVLLEIRRERGVELALEGFRFDDIRRWARGDLLEMPYEGIYVPEMNQLYDLNQDGSPDVSFVSSTPSNAQKGVVYVVVDNSSIKLSEGDKGNVLWLSDITKKWEDYKYIYPIPHNERVLNPDLSQNPMWE